MQNLEKKYHVACLSWLWTYCCNYWLKKKAHNPLDNLLQVLIKSGFNIMKWSIIIQAVLEQFLTPHCSISALKMTVALSNVRWDRLIARSFLNIFLCEVKQILTVLPNHVCLLFYFKHTLNTHNEMEYTFNKYEPYQWPIQQAVLEYMHFVSSA